MMGGMVYQLNGETQNLVDDRMVGWMDGWNESRQKL